MQTSERLLEGYSDREKGAYLGVIASLATADRRASEEEITHLTELCDQAGVSDQQRESVLKAATDLSGEELRKCLDILKTSELRFSLLTDLIALAEADDEYTDDERKNIEQISKYLNVDQKQFSLLDQFVHRAADNHTENSNHSVNSLADSTGMRNQLSGSGLNIGSLGKGIFGMLGPMILGGIAAKTLGGRRSGGGMLGGMMGGGLGGMLGGMMGGGRSTGLPGGLGSILSGLSRSRNNRSMGGLLSRIL